MISSVPPPQKNLLQLLHVPQQRRVDPAQADGDHETECGFRRQRDGLLRLAVDVRCGRGPYWRHAVAAEVRGRTLGEGFWEWFRRTGSADSTLATH